MSGIVEDVVSTDTSDHRCTSEHHNIEGLSRSDTPIGKENDLKISPTSGWGRTSEQDAAADSDFEEGFPPGRSIIAVVEKIFTPSWLLELPKEARQTIYWHYFFPYGQDHAPSPHFSATSTWRVKPPSLLQTCRSIRDEAIPLYYDEFYVVAKKPLHLVPWLRSLDPRARMALGIVNIAWDGDDQKRRTPEKQVNKAWVELKKRGTEIRRDVIEIISP